MSQPFAVWLTGLPASGKSTIATELKRALAEAGLNAEVLASDALRLTERYTRVGPNTLQYEVTVDDPQTWTRPWTFMIPLKRTQQHIYEYACHEGNFGLSGILSGARAEERAAAH